MKKKILWILNEYNSDKTDISPALIWWHGILEELNYEVFYYAYEDYNIEELVELVKQNKIDYIIVAAYSEIHTEMIRLREYSKLYVLQSDDRWRYPIFSKFWIPFVDGVITFEGELKNYVSDGLKQENFHKMRWAFNPNSMSKVVDSKRDAIYVSHTGGMHGNRQQMINEFIKKGISVFNKKTNTYEETKHIWSYSKYSLCFTNNSLNTGKELKGRVVEIPNWCVLLTEPFPDMEQYYDIDNDIIVFNSVDEAIEKIKFLENNPREYNRIFQNGKNKLWSQNTAFDEWNMIMFQIDKDYKGAEIDGLLEKYK